MINETKEKLKKILYNIELQISDLKLEKEGYKLKFYFDAFDVEDSIKGFSCFYKGKEFNNHLFASEKTLVHCLASSGNLPPIHVLAPHKAELFNRLKKLKYSIEERPDRKALIFLEESSSKFFNKKDIFSKAYYDETIQNFITQPEQAERLFVSVQSLSPWYKRLEEVINEQRLMLENDNENISYASIISSEHFDKLKRIFKFFKTDEKSINNLSDAIAISLLIEKITLYKLKKTSLNKEIPIFFASSYLMKIITGLNASEYDSKINKDLLFIQERLTFDTTSQKLPIGVMRNEDYFIFKATFGHNETASNRQVQIEVLLKRLNSWKNQIENFLDVDEEITKESWVIDLAQREREFFFKDIWLKSKAPRDLYNAVVNTIRAYEEFKEKGEKELRNKISIELEKTENKIRGEAEDARMIVLLSQELETGANGKVYELRRNFKLNNDNLKQQIFNFFPFYRYSFPVDSQEKISELFSGLLSPQTADIIFDQLLKEYAEFIDIANDPTDSKIDLNIETLAALTATLHAIDIVSPLKHLLHKIDPNLPHYSFKIVFVELHFPPKNLIANFGHSNEKTGRAKQIIKELEKEFDLENIRKNKNGLAIGLALIYYRWWSSKAGNSMWSLLEDEISQEENTLIHNRHLLEKALFYAEQAYYLSVENKSVEPEAIYALNLSLYFLTKSDNNNEKDLEKLNNYAKKLIAYASHHKDMWQFRYDDTLSVYYGKLAALYSNTKREFKENIREAFDYNKKAKKISPYDLAVNENERLLKTIKANYKYS